jgi:hypothetical protein
MPLRDYWAYDFACDRSLPDMQAALDAAGPWKWAARDSAWYGEYLHAVAADGARVALHCYPQEGAGGTFTGLRESGWSVLLKIDAASAATQEEVDRIFQGLLQKVGAGDVREIEPYD